MGLKHLIEKLEPHFTHGGKLEKYYPLYEAAATIFYTPGVTAARARARRHRPEADDDPRVVCRIPGDVLGHVQRWAADHSGAAQAIRRRTAAAGDRQQLALQRRPVVRGELQCRRWLAEHDDPARSSSCRSYYRFIVGGFWEVLFAIVRKHEINEGFSLPLFSSR